MKKTTLTCALAFLFVLTANSLFAQFVPKAVQANNTVIQGLTDKVEPNGWLYFKESAALDADTYFDDYATAMGLGANDEMVKIKEWESNGQTHIKYKQYYKSIPVKGGEYTLHLTDCNVKSASSSTGGTDTHNVYMVTGCLDGGSPPCKVTERASNAEALKLTQEENLGKEVKVFPNPVTGKLTVAVNGLDGDYKVEVANMLGNIVASYKADGTSLQIETEGLSAGTYVLRVVHPQYQKTLSFVKL